MAHSIISDEINAGIPACVQPMYTFVYIHYDNATITTTTFKLKIFNYLILTLLPIIKLSPIFITIYYH